MATKLDKTITRETAMIHKTRPVLVSLHPRGVETAFPLDMIEFRLKGTQQTLRAPLEEVFRFVQRRSFANGRS
jgi:hypothetical protein